MQYINFEQMKHRLDQPFIFASAYDDARDEPFYAVILSTRRILNSCVLTRSNILGRFGPTTVFDCGLVGMLITAL